VEKGGWPPDGDCGKDGISQPHKNTVATILKILVEKKKLSVGDLEILLQELKKDKN
jgi:hypothetical protein